MSKNGGVSAPDHNGISYYFPLRFSQLNEIYLRIAEERAGVVAGLRHLSLIQGRSVGGEGEEVTFVTRLPLDIPIRSKKPPAGALSPPGAQPLPTHVLVDGVAYPISSKPFEPGSEVEHAGK